MFISREEIERRKTEAEERVRPIIGEEYLYYHVVGKPNHPAHDYGICASEVLVAGFRYSEDENSPYDVDLAVPTQTEDLFVLLSNVKIETAHAVLEGNQKVVFVEYEHREWMEKAVNAWAEKTLGIRLPAKKKPSHLSLVVDNANTVEEMVKSPVSAEMCTEDILTVLRQNIGPRFMPKSTLGMYGKQKSPTYLKATDDGEFFRQLLAMDKSGLFKRDALLSNEIFAVLNMDGYKIIASLNNEQVFVGATGGVKMHEWVPRSGVDLERLLLAVNDL